MSQSALSVSRKTRKRFVCKRCKIVFNSNRQSSKHRRRTGNCGGEPGSNPSAADLADSCWKCLKCGKSYQSDCEAFIHDNKAAHGSTFVCQRPSCHKVCKNKKAMLVHDCQLKGVVSGSGGGGVGSAGPNNAGGLTASKTLHSSSSSDQTIQIEVTDQSGNVFGQLPIDGGGGGSGGFGGMTSTTVEDRLNDQKLTISWDSELDVPIVPPDILIGDEEDFANDPLLSQLVNVEDDDDDEAAVAAVDQLDIFNNAGTNAFTAAADVMDAAVDEAAAAAAANAAVGQQLLTLPLEQLQPLLVGQQQQLASSLKHPKPQSKNSYLCSLCGKTLKGLTSYTRHQVTHTGQRPFKCNLCPKSFTQNQRLVIHKRIHTGERPFLCSLCGKTFTESCKLKRHLSKIHQASCKAQKSKNQKKNVQQQLGAATESTEAAAATAAVTPAAGVKKKSTGSKASVGSGGGGSGAGARKKAKASQQQPLSQITPAITDRVPNTKKAAAAKSGSSQNTASANKKATITTKAHNTTISAPRGQEKVTVVFEEH